MGTCQLTMQITLQFFLFTIGLITITAQVERSLGDECRDIGVKNTENIKACLLQGRRCCRNLTRSRQQAINCMDRVARILSKEHFAQGCSCQYPSCLEMFSEDNDNIEQGKHELSGAT